MEANKPYLYLKQDVNSEIYSIYIAIRLENYQIIDADIPTPISNKPLNDHENPTRRFDPLDSYYRPDLFKALIEIPLDRKDGNMKYWSRKYDFKYADLYRDDPKRRSEFIQVIVEKSDTNLTHDGSSTAHLGDPD